MSKLPRFSEILFSGDEDESSDDADDQCEAKIGYQRKRECHVSSDAIGRKDLDEQDFSQT